ncbi:ammonium transporter Amt1 [Bulinus truncatus]|nr:ammonium transporter Amt1 [Bulinus truncatus]
MVSICGGCNAMRPWGAALVGFIAAFIMKALEKLLIRFEIDDPLNAVGIHFGGGVWGTLSVAIFKYNSGILMEWSQRSAAFLAWQLVAVSSIILWTGSLAIILFGTLKILGIFRVSEEIEKKGLDIARHNQPAYPLEAYGHGHVEEIKRVTSDGKLASFELGFNKHLGLPSYFSHHESPDGKVFGMHRPVTLNEETGHSNEGLATSGTQTSNKLDRLRQLLHLSPRQEKKSTEDGEIFKVLSVGVDITKL